MTDTDSGGAATRPAGEVIGRQARQWDTLRAGVLGDMMGEFLGTFALIAFGDGVVAMAVAALNSSGRAQSATTVFLATAVPLTINSTGTSRDVPILARSTSQYGC